MSKTKNRVVAGLLAFTLILTGMSGLNGIAMVNAATEDAEVTSIDATPKEISYKGGEVTLKVNGINLTEDNWGVQAKAYIVGTDIDKTPAVEVKNVTESSATLVVPMNTFVNDLEYRVVAGVKDGEGIKEQARTTFVIKAKPVMK